MIVEGFVDFEYEITLLTVRHAGGTSFCAPIGHLQVDGDYRESWQPQPMSGAALLESGVGFYNPDEAARKIVAANAHLNPPLTMGEVNAAAWSQGRTLLERAIDEHLDFAFETTLGGHTITSLLMQAAEQGIEVQVWYVGLSSPELHIERVQARVSRGGRPARRSQAGSPSARR